MLDKEGDRGFQETLEYAELFAPFGCDGKNKMGQNLPDVHSTAVLRQRVMEALYARQEFERLHARRVRAFKRTGNPDAVDVVDESARERARLLSQMGHKVAPNEVFERSAYEDAVDFFAFKQARKKHPLELRPGEAQPETVDLKWFKRGLEFWKDEGKRRFPHLEPLATSAM